MVDESNMENVYVRLPFSVARMILERAGYIHREEGRSMVWYEGTGQISKGQMNAIKDLMDGLCED